MVEQALLEDDVVTERHGKPHPAILNYARYQQLIALSQQLTHPYLMLPMLPDTSDAALAAQVRQDLQDRRVVPLEETR